MTERIVIIAVVAAFAAAAGPGPAPAQPPVDECAAPGADWIFCSGFEEGSFAVWDDWDGNPPTTNVILADPGPAGLAGNHVARLRVPAGTGAADLIKELPGGHDRLYARWHVKWEPGYDFSARNHGSGMWAGARALMGTNAGVRPDGTDRFSASLEHGTTTPRLTSYAYYRGMYQDCANPAGNCWGDHLPCLLDDGQRYCVKSGHRDPPLPPVLETGRWYCIEMLLDGGTPVSDGTLADGVLDFWIDGVQYGPWDDLWLRTTAELKLTVLYLSLYHHSDHSVEGIQLDNVVVSTAPIGCLGGTTPAVRTSWRGTKARYR